jgi:hypothetical protein
MHHADEIKQNYLSLLVDFTAAFPGIDPPANHWWLLWLQRYPFADIRGAIQTLSRHHLKPRFTTESTGKALSALLRESAVRRAMTPPQAAGGQS